METLSSVAGKLAGTLTQLKSPQPGAKAGDGADFDSMIRGKCRQADEQKTQEKPTDGTASEAKDEAEVSTDGVQEKAEAVKEEPKQLEDMKQQYELAAALMYQAQPNYVEAPQEAALKVQQAGEVVEVMPETVAEQAVIPENVQTQQEQTVEVAVGEVQPETKVHPEELSKKPVEAAEEVQPQQDKIPAEAEKISDTKTEVPKEQFTEVSAEGEKAQEKLGEAPVFENVETVPVKVAEAPAEPVKVEAQDAPEQLAERIEVPLQRGESRAVIELAPESLGKLTVQITRSADGTLSVLLHATSPKAAALLEQHSTGLQNLLASRNDAEVHIEVRGGEESRQQFLNPDGRNGQHDQQQGHHQRGQNEPQKEHQVSDFIQQLRLGLVEMDESSL